jgi:hypothetical protein
MPPWGSGRWPPGRGAFDLRQFDLRVRVTLPARTPMTPEELRYYTVDGISTVQNYPIGYALRGRID